MSSPDNGVVAASEHDAIPIVIAVTGHRTIPSDILPQLEQAVAELIRTLRQQYPSTPLRFLSGLAEGADRLAAKVALEHAAQLVAVLPLVPAAYEQDFPTAESRGEFQQLLSAATEIVITDADELLEVDRAARGRYYARQGAFLVQNCDILLAFWDGEAGDGEGGTADIVKYRLEGVPKQYDASRLLFEKRIGPVYQVVTPRHAVPTTESRAGTVRMLYPVNFGRRTSETFELNESLAAVDGFNRDLRELAASGFRRTSSFGEQEHGADMTPAAKHSFQRLQRLYDLSNQLAIRFQARTWQLFKLMLVCSVSSLVCLQIHTNLHKPAGIFLTLYVVLLLAAYAIYGWSKQNRYESRAFDYRAMAEGLRVQCYWQLAGLRASVADRYLRRQHGVLDWIRRALMIWTMAGPKQDADAAASVQRLNRVATHWVAGQLRFFASTAQKQRLLQIRLGRMANALFLLGVVVAAMKMVAGTSTWMTSLAAVPPLIAAALLVYGNTRALSEQVNQYESMRELFEAADEQLRTCLASGDVAAGEKLLLELGKEALAESADWLMLHRRRTVSSPSVG